VAEQLAASQEELSSMSEDVVCIETISAAGIIIVARE
jgi:hypothetical protein